MVQQEKEESTRTCNVCGNVLEKYQRLCDRCGSIQRPVKARGVGVEPETREKAGSCDKCGVEVPPNKSLCKPCAEAVKKAAGDRKKESSSGLAALLRRFTGGLKHLIARLTGGGREA